jgi:proline racemase
MVPANDGCVPDRPAHRRFTHVLTVVDCHTAGAPARLLLRGAPPVQGADLRERLAAFRTQHDHIRTTLMREPRGHDGMYGAVLLAPSRSDADVAALFMNAAGFAYMCGHVSMAIGLVATRTPYLAARDRRRIVVETPLGLVVLCPEGDHAIRFRNIPSFFVGDVEVAVEGIGTINVAVAFGGDFFALIEVGAVAGRLADLSIASLTRLGARVLEALRAYEVGHPEFPEVNYVNDVMFHGLRPAAGGAIRGLVTWGVDQFDRSPCGSGTSALLAMLYAKRRIAMGRPVIVESIAGTTFTGVIRAETQVGGIPAVIAEIIGRPHIIGLNRWVIDPDDSIKHGLPAFGNIT